MADVLIVCVREDEPQAKALAEMFEAAGFSIGGAPAGDGALRSSGAGLVVWSQASIRSRPFLDAAQRVINADKAVVASLIEPPPPSSIGNSPVFDLSNWDGDPNDPALDPLFFAVDRMVNSARAAVGANTARTPEPEAYEPPPARREPPPPPPRPAPRPAAPPATYTRAPADPLGSEAEHWRAIRDSKDPADFMDYLSRYGPEGAFAEVAELRLKQLTARSEPPRPAPPRPAPPPPPRPAPRPSVRLDPPPQRREPPPPLRRPDPPRRTPPSFDRPELHEPPRGEGGALRAFVLIALLGGAALAGGLYFGGGLPNFGSSSTQSSETASTAPSASAPTSEEPGDALDQPVGTPIEEAIAPSTRPAAPAPRDTTRPTQPAPSRTQTADTQSNDTVTPPPSTSWANAAPSSSGPVSLRPNENPTTPAPTQPGPVQGPSLDAPNTVVASAAPPPQPLVRAGAVQWSARPSARRVAELYPARAARQGAGGRVALDCTVRSDLGVNCAVASETPAELGFGRAAVSASASYRAMPTLSNGASAVGAHTRIVMQFQAPPSP